MPRSGRSRECCFSWQTFAPEVNCKNIAVIRKTDEGKLKVTETGKIRNSHGAKVGALVAGTSLGC